jgi:hypothetical protein
MARTANLWPARQAIEDDLQIIRQSIGGLLTG